MPSLVLVSVPSTSALPSVHSLARVPSVVERVTLKRKPQPELDAVYFLSPREESIQGMISDFERGQRTYAKGHAFFTSRTPAARNGHHLRPLSAQARSRLRVILPFSG